MKKRLMNSKCNQIYFVIIFLAFSNHISAQNIDGCYSYRAGEKVSKQIVAYAAETEAAEDTVWDLSDLRDEDLTHRVQYSEVYQKDRLIAGYEDGTNHYYEQSGDSLLLWGSENNLTKTEYDRPVLMLHTPLAYGSSHSGLFHGRESYCERAYSRVFGTWRLTVDGTGTLLLPEGDTLRNVSRVHLHEVTVTRHYPHIMTGEELKAYTDSIAVFTDDSIRAGLQDSTATVTDIYRWYAPGYRHPVLETVTKTWPLHKTLLDVAYYCPPSEQELLADEENEQIRDSLLSARERQGGGGGQDNGGGTDAPPSPLSRCDVTVSGSVVTVTYDLTEDATVTGIVSTVSGMLLRQQSRHSDAGTGFQMDIDCGGLRHGQYVLYMNVNGQVTGYTVNLQ